MSETKKGSVRAIFGKATDAMSSTAKNLKTEFDQSKVKAKIDETTQTAYDFLKEKGVIDQAEKISNGVSERLDVISGAKILALVEERLDIQSRYNDILATKLEEALNRIADLESKLTPERQK